MSTKVMGILNVTPDSFSDGGLHIETSQAIARARQMMVEGADIIDIGGESSRPNAEPISVEEELTRVIPVIRAIRAESNIAISIDTYKPEVMRQAVQFGATFINDIYALQAPGALEAAHECGVQVCLMHMQGKPRHMQDAPFYTDIIQEIKDFFAKRIEACEKIGIAREQLILDPGFGFGKTVQHNLQLIKNLAEFKIFHLPLLMGVSRKSTIGTILNKPAHERLHGSIAATVISVMNGADIIRTHDVAATVDAIKVTNSFMEQKNA